jgi:hypothetical protein
MDIRICSAETNSSFKEAASVSAFAITFEAAEEK